jgi:ribosomal protein S27AE
MRYSAHTRTVSGSRRGSEAVGTEERKWKCGKCNVELKLRNTVFSYLGHTFSHNVPTCPKCGKVFIPQELAENRIAEVEELLEDK